MTKKRFSVNLAKLEFIARKLGELKNEVVFLGGSTTALFITDPNVPDIRNTIDVDCIVDVLSKTDYYKLEKLLRSLGFKQNVHGDTVICRWYYDEAILDIMPTNDGILNFGNRWYSGAVKNAIAYQLCDDLNINIVTAPYFIATKMEAFHGRGNNDFLASHDLEDIITIIDGRAELKVEIDNSDKILKEYIRGKLLDMLNEDRFLTAIPGHLNYGNLTTERTLKIINRIKDMANIVV